METPKRKLCYMILAIVLCMISALFCYYIYIAGSRVPIMDYWEWIADYGPRFTDHSINIRDFIVNPDKSTMSSQHVSPGSMALQMWILYIFKYDVRILVFLGTVIHIITGAVIAFIFYKKNYDKYNSKICTFFTAILLYIVYLNLNQWEILSQPFTFTFSIRSAMYLISFIWAQKYFDILLGESDRTKMAHTIIFGIYCMLLTDLISSAYFVGHLFAIIFIGFIKVFRCGKINKKSKYAFGLYILIQIIGVILYIKMMHLSAGGGTKSSQMSFNIMHVIQGIFVYIGSLIVPQSYVEVCGYIPAMTVGIVIFIIMLTTMVLYFKNGLDREHTFALMCIIYAGVTAATISVGRISAFGIGTMNSSRYVTESTVGLVGLVILCYKVVQHTENKKGVFIDKIILGCALAIGLIMSAYNELKIAPYRGIYNKQLYSYMMDIDNADDSALAMFQNTPDNVRYVTNYFKEHKYSIFAQDYNYR